MSTKIKMIAMALFAMLGVTVSAQNLRIDKVEVRGREIKATDGAYDLGVLRAGTGRNANEKKDICKVTLSNIDNRAVELKIDKGGMVFFYDEGTVSNQRFYPMTIQAGGKSTFSFICKRDAESSPMSKRNSFRIKARYLSGNDDASFETKDVIWVNFYGLLSDNELAFMERDGKWGAMDINQKTVIPFEYEGLVARGSNVRAKKNGKWGLINGLHNVSIPFEYDELDDIGADYKAQKNGKWGVVNFVNKVLIPFEYDSLGKEGCSTSFYYIPAKKNGKMGIIKKNENKVLIPFEYDNMGKYNTEGTMAVKNGKYGVVGENNHVVIPFEYEDMTDSFKVHDLSLFNAKKNGKWGVIDLTNRIVVPFEYEDHIYFSKKDEYARVKKNGKWGKVDKNNNIVTPFEYDDWRNLY